MARWRLQSAHYLNVPGTEWEHRETNRDTGRQARKVYEVPLLLDPKDPADCNYPGEIIIAYAGKGQGRDIIFEGPPTPEMEPLDEEAEAITEAERPRWQAVTDSPGLTYGESLLIGLQKQLDAVARQVGAMPAAPMPTNAISPDALTVLQNQIAELMESNAKMQAQLAERQAGTDRRV